MDFWKELSEQFLDKSFRKKNFLEEWPGKGACLKFSDKSTVKFLQESNLDEFSETILSKIYAEIIKQVCFENSQKKS